MTHVQRIATRLWDPRVAAFFAIVVSAIWIRQWPTLTQPLVEAHAFRQTQTAYQTLSLAEGWGSLLHPKLPVFGSPFEVPFEFPLFQLSASYLIRFFGVASDTANRSAGLTWFTLCLVPLWNIARIRLDRVSSAVVIVVFSFSPFALQWSRTSMIDFCSVFLALVFVYAFYKSWTTHTTRWLVTMATVGALAGMVKATTLVIVGIMGVVMTPGLLEALGKPTENLRRLGWNARGWIVVAAATFLWTRRADEIKESHQATKWLSSRLMSDWNYGTLQQRRLYGNWSQIIDRIDTYMVPHHSALLLLLVPLVAVSMRRFAVAVLASALAGPLIFFNLFVAHDYYLMAITAQVALLLGIAVSVITERVAADRRIVVTVGLVAVMLVTSWIPAKPYIKLAHTELVAPVNELTALSSPDQRVFVGYNDWDPTTLYYARRKGIMLDPRGATLETIRTMTDLNTYDFYQGPPEYKDVIGIRGWYAPAGAATIRIDDSRADLSGYGVVFSSNATSPEFDASTTGGSTQRTVRLACDDSSTFRLSDIPTGVTVRTTPTAPNLVFVVNALAAVPVGTFMEVDATIAATNNFELRCRGGSDVVLDWWE